MSHFNPAGSIRRSPVHSVPEISTLALAAGCPTLAAPLFLRLGWDLMSHFNLAGAIRRSPVHSVPEISTLALAAFGHRGRMRPEKQSTVDSTSSPLAVQYQYVTPCSTNGPRRAIPWV